MSSAFSHVKFLHLKFKFANLVLICVELRLTSGFFLGGRSLLLGFGSSGIGRTFLCRRFFLGSSFLSGSLSCRTGGLFLTSQFLLFFGSRVNRLKVVINLIRAHVFDPGRERRGGSARCGNGRSSNGRREQRGKCMKLHHSILFNLLSVSISGRSRKGCWAECALRWAWATP